MELVSWLLLSSSTTLLLCYYVCACFVSFLFACSYFIIDLTRKLNVVAAPGWTPAQKMSNVAYFTTSLPIGRGQSSATVLWIPMCCYLDNRNKQWRRTQHGRAHSLAIRPQFDQRDGVWRSVKLTARKLGALLWLRQPARVANCTEWGMSSNQPQQCRASLWICKFWNIHLRIFTQFGCQFWIYGVSKAF
jgi:hypothetical protein